MSVPFGATPPARPAGTPPATGAVPWPRADDSGWTSQQRVLATTDELTGLPNRRATIDALDHWHAAEVPAAVLHLDLARFREVTAAHGSAEGDVLLMHVTSALSSTLRRTDWLSRVGGDEFLIARPHGSTAEAVALAGAIRALFRREHWGPAHSPHPLSCRIGIAVAREPGERMLELVATALGRAKDLGETQVYHPDMTRAARERSRFLGRFAIALDQDELELHYQPQCDPDGRIIGAEALVRWRHDGELLAPGSFLPAVEDSLLIHRLGAWVIESASAQVSRWRAAGLAVPPIAVNLSPRQFADVDSNVAATVAGALARHRLPAAALEVELTETSVMPMPGEIHPEVEGLVALGIPLVIDDFGTGYSSLASLTRLPIAKVKLDRSLIERLGTDDRCRIIVETALWMSARLGIGCVAEGVETATQLEALTTSGCTSLQGYHFSRPLPADDFRDRFLK